MNRLRIEQVVFAASTPLILPAGTEWFAIVGARRKRCGVAHQHFFGDDVHANAADARRRPGEIVIDDILAQSDRFEHLCAVITLDGGNAHFRSDFDHTFSGCFDEILTSQFVIDVGQHAIADHAIHGLEGEVRIDRAAAIADQQGKVVHFARLSRFQHQTDAGS